jgi:hypothetical protein
VHPRQSIREAIKTALVNQTDAGARVYESRMAPLRKGGLPAIIVYTVSESVEESSRHTAPRILDRHVQVAVEVATKASDNVDDLLDDLAVQIEKALDKDPTLGNKANDVFLTSTEIELFEEQSERIGAMKMVYDVWYSTNAPDASDIVLDDFDKADVKYDLGGTQEDTNQANDRVNLP